MEIQKWEYKVLSYYNLPSDIEQILNEYGSEGWELTVSPAPVGITLIFKRPVSISKNNSEIKSSYMDYVEKPQE